MIRWLAILGFALLASPLRAQDCRLALVLAIDVSSSVDEAEYALQRNGLAAALLAPEVEHAFLSAPLPVALAVFEWNGRFNQRVLLDWRIVRGAEDLYAASSILAASERTGGIFPTAMGHALSFGAVLLQRAPKCQRQTIDVSGDGINNDGYGPTEAYRHFPFQNVVVNGLVIMSGAYEAATELIPFYRENVLKGPSAFLEIANGFDDFERAMRRKLEREVSGLIVSQANLGVAE